VEPNKLTPLTQFANVACLLSFRSLHDFELDFFAFREGAIAVRIDRSVLDAPILSSTFRLNEAKALLVVEPFYLSDRHTVTHLLSTVGIRETREESAEG